MSEQSREPFELYRARHLPEAHALRFALEQAGIQVVIDNELLQGAGGEIPLGWSTAPTVLVDAVDRDAAQAILAEFLDRSSQSEKDAPVRCLACKTPMDDAEVCPACGWTYKTAAEDKATSDEQTSEPNVVEPQPATADEREPVLSRSAIWWEIAAVLAVGVVPHIIDAIVGLMHPTPPLPYGLHSFFAIGLDACTIFAVLYIIYRSGESWESFGITRPRLLDAILAVVLLVVIDALWRLVSRLPIDRVESAFPVPGPKSTMDHMWMWARFFVSAFCEELVARCYLITRLKAQLRSRVVAVIIAAALFASYHTYQGVYGTVGSFAFGLMMGSIYLLRPRIWPFAIGHALVNIALELQTPIG